MQVHGSSCRDPRGYKVVVVRPSAKDEHRVHHPHVTTLSIGTGSDSDYRPILMFWCIEAQEPEVSWVIQTRFVAYKNTCKAKKYSKS